MQTACEGELRALHRQTVLELTGQHLTAQVRASIGEKEGAAHGGEIAATQLGVVTPSQSGRGHVFIPKEFILLPERRGVPSAPGREGTALELDKVSVRHEVGIVALTFVIRYKSQVGGLLASAAARTHPRAH